MFIKCHCADPWLLFDNMKMIDNANFHSFKTAWRNG